MTEDKDDLFLRRRSSTIEKLIEKYINEVEEEEILFSDEYEFADNIISWVVQDLTTSDYSDHDYDKLTDLIKDEFGDYILSQYTEFDELDEDMFPGWDELDNNEQDMDTGEKLYPSFSPDKKFMGMSKSMGDMETKDEDNLFEQEEPETDRYMFFSNLEQIHRQTGILLEKDPNMISEILDNGHDWAQDHIATSKETIDQVFDFFMNEEKGDDDEDFEDDNI